MSHPQTAGTASASRVSSHASVGALAGAWPWAAAVLAIYVLGVLPSLNQPLLESHAFRQTQTAYTAVLFAEQGIDLFRPPLPVLGPPGIIPLEFPLFQAAGATAIDAGIPPDLAMRLTGLVCFLATAALVHLLAHRLAGPVAGIGALGAFLFTAHAWVYGRASLIEYLAAGAGVAYLLAALRWSESERPGYLGLAFVAGTVAVLVKITTGGFYLLPALLLRTRSGRLGFQRPALWGVVVAVGVLGLLWSSYAQSVRDETPAAAFLALQNQLGWLFGTPSQRLDVAEWRVPLVATLMLTGSAFVVWAPLAVRQARQLPEAQFVLAMLACAVGAPLILFNLYAEHDYYFAAIAPIVAIGIGLGVDWLLARRQRRFARRLMVGLAGAWVATIIGLYPTWSIVYGTPPEAPRAMQIARFIRENSAPDDWIILRGLGWNPSFLYYARRQGIAVPETDGLQDTSTIDFERILTDPQLGPTISCDSGGECSVTGR